MTPYILGVLFVYGLLHTRSYGILGWVLVLVTVWSIPLSPEFGPLQLYMDFGWMSMTLLWDELALWLCLIVLLCMSWVLVSMTLKNGLTSHVDLVILYAMVCSLLFFMASELFSIYILFELVTIPILLYVGALGVSSRRVYALSIMIIYILMSSGLFALVLYMYLDEFTDAQNIYISVTRTGLSSDTWLVSLLVMIFIAVKVPVYPFYVWLPEAHVESNSEMSIVLASVILKFSLLGIVRLSHWLESTYVYSITHILMLVCVVGLIQSAITSIHHLDLKKLIAYSSIVHMQLSALGLFCHDHVGLLVVVLTSIVHGIVSIGLFYLIGVVSETVGTRHVAFVHAGVSLTPLISLIGLFTILLNISVPLSVASIVELLTLMVYSSYGDTILFIGSACAVWFCSLFSLILLYRAFMSDSSWFNNDTTDMTVLDTGLMILSYSLLVVGMVFL